MIPPTPPARLGRRESSPLQLLQALAPPQSLIHIGAGTGQGELHQWHSWGLPQVFVVDADIDRLTWVEPLAAANPGWQVREAIVADVDDTVTYYQASNPAEDGLFPAGPLRALWPNLRVTGQDQRAAQRLDTLLAQADAPTTAHGNTWLLIDCLPALPILHGAAATLRHCTVIAVRVLLQPVVGIGAGAGLSEIEDFLQRHGFKGVASIEGHQPAIGHTLFVRDWPAALQLQADCASAQAQLATEVQARLTELQDQLDRLRLQRSKLISDYDQLARARDQVGLERDQLAQEKSSLIVTQEDLTRAKAELTTQRDAEAQAKGAAITQRDQEAKAKAEALAQRDAQAQLATERQASVATLQTQIDQLAQEKSSLIVTQEDLTRAKAELTTQRDAEAQAKASAQQEIISLQQRIQQLEADTQQTQYRHQLQHEEMIKAEAQIELIKDLLLREPGL